MVDLRSYVIDDVVAAETPHVTKGERTRYHGLGASSLDVIQTILATYDRADITLQRDVVDYEQARAIRGIRRYRYAPLLGNPLSVAPSIRLQMQGLAF
jgi:hypothetical protein